MIVSLDQVKKQWCTHAQYNKGIVVDASSMSDGKANTDKVMSRSDSAEYSAFEWCRAKGNDWYLPAIDELKLLYSVRDTINSTLKERGGNTLSGWCWSSTEYENISAWNVVMDYGYTFHGNKTHDNCVRAVSAF